MPVWSQNTDVSRIQNHARLLYLPKCNLHLNFERLNKRKVQVRSLKCGILETRLEQAQEFSKYDQYIMVPKLLNNSYL